jgi:hypothetical protein
MITPERLAQIDAMCTGFGMSVAEQRELVRGYRAQAALLETLRWSVDVLLGMDLDNQQARPTEDEYQAMLAEARAVLEIGNAAFSGPATGANQ